MSDLEEYLAENYGTCDLGTGCYWKPGCLKLGWKGLACEYWKPLGVKTWAELHEAIKSSYASSPEAAPCPTSSTSSSSSS